MAFDIEGARKSGYSDAEISDYLKTSGGTKFDFDGAAKAGYTPTEILSYVGAQKPEAVSQIDDVKKSVGAEVSRLGRSTEDLGRSLYGGFANIGNKVGIISNATKDSIDDANVAAITKNRLADESPDNYQAQTTSGKVAQGVTHMAPAIGLGLINPLAGIAAFEAQGGWDAGKNAVDSGDSLANANLKAGGGALLNGALGHVIGGGGNAILSKIPVIGDVFLPAAVDTAKSLAGRAVQGAATMGVFKPVGTAIDYAADKITGESGGKNYDFVPSASDLITGAVVGLPHSGMEYMQRNKRADTPNLPDGAESHSNGSLFTSEDAAESFKKANGLDTAAVIPVTEKLFNPESTSDKVLGYAVKPDDATIAAHKEQTENDTLSKLNAIRPSPADLFKSSMPEDKLAALEQSKQDIVDQSKVNNITSAPDIDTAIAAAKEAVIAPIEPIAQTNLSDHIDDSDQAIDAAKAKAKEAADLAEYNRMGNVVPREQLPIDSPMTVNKNQVTQGIHDLYANHDSIFGTKTSIVDKLPGNADGMVYGKDGTLYVHKDASLSPVDIFKHEVSHIFDNVLGDSETIKLADNAVTTSMTPEAKARYAMYYHGDGSALPTKIKAVLTAEQIEQAGKGDVSKKNAKGEWVNDLNLTPEQSNKIADIFHNKDGKGFKYIPELRADLRAHALTESGYWTTFKDSLIKHFGEDKANSIFSNLVNAFKSTLEKYQEAYKNKPSFAVRQLVTNHQDIYSAIAKADAEAMNVRDVTNAKSEKKEAESAARKELIDGLQEKTNKELRDIAANHPRVYMKTAASDLVAERDADLRLTKSIAAKDQLKKSSSVNPNVDSMADAIAKLGGINRESVAQRLQLAPEELNAKGQVGFRAAPLFHKYGMNMERMAERLAELGYIHIDEGGKHDQHDFEEKLNDVAGGVEVHTPNAMMLRAQAEHEHAMQEVGAKSKDDFAQTENDVDKIQHIYDETIPKDDSDIPFTEDEINSNKKQSTEQNMRDFGFSEEEIQNELAREKEANSGREAEIFAEDAPDMGIATREARNGNERDQPENFLQGESANEASARLEKEDRQAYEDRQSEQEQHNRAQADKEVDNFGLTGSERAADRNDGQNNLFSPKRPPTLEEMLAMEHEEITIDSPISTGEDFEKAAHAFLSNFPEGTTKYDYTNPYLQRVKTQSLRAAAAIDGDPKAIRRNGQDRIGSFNGYTTRGSIEKGLDGKEQLVVSLYGNVQIRDGLTERPALKIDVTHDGELSIYGPPSDSKTYAEFVKRGWAEPAKGKDGQTRWIDKDAGTFWTRLTNSKERDLIPLLADVHARTLAWTGEEKTGLHWHRETGATGGEDGRKTAAYFSPKREETWHYSQLSKSIEEAPDRVFGAPKQVAMWLDSNAGKLGVKKDEIQWTGVTDWLNMQTRKVSKADVLDYLRSGGVKVQEVMKGSNEYHEFTKKMHHKYGDSWIHDMSTAEEIQKKTLFDDGNNDSSTKYESYQLPGGENYRELLLTLPARNNEQFLVRDKITGNEISRHSNRDEAFQANQSMPTETRFDRQIEPVRSNPEYQSSHWDEKNILAHIRFNDRTDTEGNKVLFIEELQSDWGQEGLKKGFRSLDFDNSIKSLEKKYGEKLSEIAQNNIWTKEEKNRYLELKEKSGDLKDGFGLASAPFVTKTESWLQLGIKRMTAYAVEHGYDKVAFVSGEQSSSRYDLTKHIDEISYLKKPDGSIATLSATKDGSFVFDKHNIDMGEVEATFGKEIAKKIESSEGHNDNRGRKVLEGVDLKVGGEGMKTFYDKIVPQNINDVLRKIGGGKVEGVDIGVPIENKYLVEEYRGPTATLDQVKLVLDVASKPSSVWESPITGERQDGVVSRVANENPLKRIVKSMENGASFEDAMAEFPSDSVARIFGGKLIDATPLAKIETSSQTGFTITDAMRDKVSQGLPLFSPKREAQDESEPARRYTGPGADEINAASNGLGKILDDALLKVAPMSSGTQETRAIAQQHINAERNTARDWSRVDKVLTDDFSIEDRKNMYDAADEENDKLRDGVTDPTKGLDRLPKNQRNVVEYLHTWGENLWDRGVSAGLVEGKGVHFWTPRMMAVVGAEGYEAPSRDNTATSDGKGRNVGTSADSAKGRSYDTSAETEAAMNALGGELVRDIRTMPMAMAKFEKAVAGRELINSIKDLGDRIGKGLVSDVAKEGFFTLDHPSFTESTPRTTEIMVSKAELKERSLEVEDGKVWKPNSTRSNDPSGERDRSLNSYRVDKDGNVLQTVPLLDQNGNPIIDRKPLYIANDFKGPLSAIMSEKSGPMYTGYMLLKSKASSLIMANPAIHTQVILVRAFGGIGVAKTSYLYGKSWFLYLKGSGAMADEAFMHKVIDKGMVPIGGHNNMLDVGDIANGGKVGSWTDMNESWIALSAQKLGNKMQDGLGDKVKSGIDKTGDFWHNTMLWNRIGDLQAGIAKSIYDSRIKAGDDENAALTAAAHIANRYAGAMGRENMSMMMHKLLNVSLFSKSFNVGNMGTIKDVAFGLPEGLKAQLYENSSKESADRTMQYLRTKAGVGLLRETAITILVLSAFQAWYKKDKDEGITDVLGGLPAKLGSQAAKMGSNIADHPFTPGSYNPFRLSLTYNNEPGKEMRYDMGAQPDTPRHEYGRSPGGKSIEDIFNWFSDPTGTFNAKEAPMVKALQGAITNHRDSYGTPVRDPDGTLMGNVALTAEYILDANTNTDQVEGIKKGMSDKATQLDHDKMMGQLTGFSISQGHPNGPEEGVAAKVEDRMKQNRMFIMKQITELINNGKSEDAIDLLESKGFTPKESILIVRMKENPRDGMSKQQNKKFNDHANEEDREAMDRIRGD